MSKVCPCCEEKNYHEEDNFCPNCGRQIPHNACLNPECPRKWLSRKVCYCPECGEPTRYLNEGWIKPEESPYEWF